MSMGHIISSKYGTNDPPCFLAMTGGGGQWLGPWGAGCEAVGWGGGEGGQRLVEPRRCGSIIRIPSQPSAPHPSTPTHPPKTKSGDPESE